jgi:hypothetical protein
MMNVSVGVSWLHDRAELRPGTTKLRDLVVYIGTVCYSVAAIFVEAMLRFGKEGGRYEGRWVCTCIFIEDRRFELGNILTFSAEQRAVVTDD